MALAACGPMIWDRPGATQADFNADDYSCDKDVHQSQFDQGVIANAIETHQFYKKCMTAHGWALRGS